MGLSDRIKSNGNGSTAALENDGKAAHGEQIVEHRAVADPSAELKTQIDDACIAKLGPQLFTTQSDEELSERVLRAVTEQLALDRTPLTREERRQVTREITDDILGYGPLEPFLHDDTVTEVMGNGADAAYMERTGKIERTTADVGDDEGDARVHPRYGPDRHDRGRGGAPAPAAARDPARGPPLEHRGPGRDPHPRARPQLVAHASRPDHGRRGQRPRDLGHAPGDEH